MTRPVWFRRFGAGNQISPNRKAGWSIRFVPSVWQGWALMLAMILGIVFASIQLPSYFADPATGQAPVWMTVVVILAGLALFFFVAFLLSSPATLADTDDSKDKNDAQDR